MIIPIASKNPEAVMLSYPITIELKAKVGLSEISKKTKKEYFLILVRASCFEKKYRDYLRIPILILACITQITFLIFEFANIHFNGIKEYLSDGWNLLDIS